MKKQIGICALIAVLVLAVTCTSQLMAEDYRNKETKYITNTAFITAVERATYINWTKEEDGAVPLTPENLEIIRAVTELDLSYMELTDLSGIEWFSELEVLDCNGNWLTELDLSQNTVLRELSCKGNQLTELDLSHNTKLQSLSCGGNQLTELDISHNPTLEELYCYGNQLRSLDLSQNTALIRLYCYNLRKSAEVAGPVAKYRTDKAVLLQQSVDRARCIIQSSTEIFGVLQKSIEGAGAVAKHRTEVAILRQKSADRAGSITQYRTDNAVLRW